VIDLIQGSGIQVARGIQVNGGLQTTQADIFAAGDVAEPFGTDEFEAEEAVFCWQRAWAQGGIAAAGMLGQKLEPVLEAMRIRTEIFGVDLAVIGRGHLREGGHINVLELEEEGDVFRRLVFDEGMLVGAIVFGTGETVHELNRLVAERTPRQTVEFTLGLAVKGAAKGMVPETFACHCPICAAELVVHKGTRVGAIVPCQACNTDLVVHWFGRRGWLDLWRA
jgi:NAD(P)H-nitrite reductase large subunit